MTEIASFAPQFVADFLKQASKAQVDWYLSQGEPQCLNGDFLVEGKLTTKLFPGLRGVIVGKEVANVEAALEAALTAKTNALAREHEEFDEIAVGLSTEGNDLMQQFEEELLRVEEIAHIGTMIDGSLADPLKQILENMADEPAGEYAQELTFLEEALEDGAPADEIVEMMQDRGTLGFLIEVSVPARTPHGDGSASIHYHTRYTQTVYGATYQQACEKALAWARVKNASFEAKKPEAA